MNTSIRLMTEADHAGALAVYAPYVLHTAITFDYEVPSLHDFSQRLSTVAQTYPILVCEVGGVIVAYCYGGMHRYKTAYQWSVESTIYMSEAWHGRGLASIMYTALFDILRLQGFINVYAGVSVPKSKSDHFHTKFGFKTVGVFEKIGYKFGTWHDLKWFEYNLAPHAEQPAPPLPIGELRDDERVREILERATKGIQNA